jgi:hypothetical protein
MDWNRLGAMNYVRKNDMSQWCGHTRRCDTLAQAMECAEHDLQRTAHVYIWPIRGFWLVIAYTSALAD